MKAMLLRVLVVLLVLCVLFVPTRSPVKADEMPCPTHTPVDIDIRPGTDLNAINLSSNGKVPVAVLATQDFDAAQFIPEMAHLTDASLAETTGCAGALAVRWVQDDVNGDGKPDFVFFFNVQDLNFTLQTTAASLMAHGSYAAAPIHIQGTDTLVIRP